jgi:hypothetical protein
VYRDCSKPDLYRASELPWLDGVGPIPPDPPAVPLPRRTVLVRKPNRLAQVSVTAGAAVVAAGFVAAYARLDKYEEQRAALERVPRMDFNLFQYNQAGARVERWRHIAIVSGFTAAAGAAIAAFVWVNPPMRRLTIQPEIQPEKSGASVSFLSRF